MSDTTSQHRTWSFADMHIDALLVFACLGYALYHIPGELAAYLAIGDIRLIEVGKIAGIVVLLLATYKVSLSRLLKQHSVPIIAGVCTLAGFLCLLLGALLGFSRPLLIGGSIILGAGTAAGSIYWLGVCCTLDFSMTVFVLVLTNLLNSTLTLSVYGTGEIPISYLIATLMAAAPLMLAVVAKNSASFEASQDDYPQIISRQDLHTLVPIDVIVWAIVNSGTFSYIETLTNNIGNGTLAVTLGQIIPCALLLFIFITTKGRFEFRLLLITCLPLVISGIMLASTQSVEDSMSAVMFYMGLTVSRIICYAIVIMRAHEVRRSALFGVGIIMLINVVAHNSLRYFFSWVENYLSSEIILIVIIFIESLVVVTLIVRELDWLNSINLDSASLTVISPTVDHVDYGLSEREQGVFDLMLEGATAKEIASKLYISPSTVRSHISSIYEKVGVASKEEFDERFHVK